MLQKNIWKISKIEKVMPIRNSDCDNSDTKVYIAEIRLSCAGGTTEFTFCNIRIKFNYKWE